MKQLKREIYHHWMDEWGLVLLDYEGPSSDNGTFFLTCFMFLLKYLDLLTDSDRMHYEKAIFNCHVPCKEYGLFNRRPKYTVSEAHDNYQAICAGSVLFELRFHEWIYKYGEKHGYNYNNTNPGHWDIRQQHQGSSIAMYKILNGKRPELWHWLWLFGSVLITFLLKQGTTSPKLVTWLRLEALSVKSVFWKLILKLWKRLLYIRHKDGLAEVFWIYFTQGGKKPGPEHPFVAMAREAFK